ncbi:MAG: WxL domain-containing protein [Chloroflexota bacterium]|nr:WxL domain-containing protein [Chloroflexota bacterium]
MSTRFTRRPATAVALALFATSAVVLPVAAADTVTQTVTAGSRTASVANLTLTAVAYAHTAQTSTGTMTLSADDSTGSGAGWNVTILSSAFAYTGTNGGTAIPAANFSLTSAAAPVMTAGQAIDVVGGPKVPLVSPVGALNSARKTVQAEAAFGQGAYTQALGVSLSIPALSRAGTYTGTLTTTIAAAP